SSTRARWSSRRSGRASGSHPADHGSADPVRTRLERPALRGRHRVDGLGRIFDAVRPRPQRQRRRTVLEAPVTAADASGADEALALEAAIALAMRLPHDVAPIHHQRVAQAWPSWQRELPGQRPVQSELTMKAHGPGGAVVALAHVDHDLAAVRAQRRIARVVILVGRPAEKQRTVGMATYGGLRGRALDPAPGLSVPYVEPVHRPRIRRREI